MNEEVRHFSLRKLSIGLASVLVGVSIFGTSQTVKADTVADQNTSAVTNNTQNSDVQENGNIAESSFSNDDQADNAKSKTTQTQENEPKQVQAENVQHDSAPKTQETTDNKDLGAEKGIVHTSSLQEPDNQSNTVTEKTVQHDTLESGPKAQSFNLPKNSKRLNEKVLAINLIETNSSPVTNGGFDEATWGKLDVNNWQGSVQDGLYQLTKYTGDKSHIIVPNKADFEKAGKSTNGLQVGITNDTVHSLLLDREQTIAFSKTKGEKVKAIGTDWSYAFSLGKIRMFLSEFDGSNLDVSDVTNMHGMFFYTKVNDLTSLANWNVSNVTDMSGMFDHASISDLTPLNRWNTSKVTDMSWMFEFDQISDLSPLTNWKTSNVTDMSTMFEFDQISDLRPLANWDTSKVTDMSYMFAVNPDLIDVKPIANWNISSVKNNNGLSGLFMGDHKLDLTNINNTPLMQGFLKEPDALRSATFITNDADLVKATINKDLPTLTNTAKRTITFNIPYATPETITQIINYKAITTPVQVDFYKREIVKTYPVKKSDWPLDTSKQNAAVVVNGQVRFKSVKIPHINGYKAHFVRNPLNPALFMVSFFAVPRENKPSTPVEVTPSNPSANPDNTNKPANDLQKRVVTELNSNDSGWTMPTENTQPETYTVEMPADNTIDLSDLVIAEPVHAQTRTQIHVTKRFKLRKHGKKHVVKHFKHRKKTVRQFKKYRL